MTSPDPFLLQKLLKQAKQEWCEIAIIETSSHAITMHRIWWINYDMAVLTNISQDHLDLHKTMTNYVNTKRRLFKSLIAFDRKPWIKKTAIINVDSDYADLFMDETYDNLFAYWFWTESKLRATDIKHNIDYTTFNVRIPWNTLNIKTKFRWNFNVYNILAAIWVLLSFSIKPEKIEQAISEITAVPWRMEEVENSHWLNIFVDYAHTPDALTQVLDTLREFEWRWKIYTVFWATGDRDRTKRPAMWQIVSEKSDVVILTEDDNYSESVSQIIKDILPWINRKEWDTFWIIPDRENAVRYALLTAEKWDIVLVAGKWDEHAIITNDWPKKWHDKTVIEQIFKDIEDNSIIDK
jgi:UDP-N-acetylmuramyl-tripeptide synthetase